jgi:hypothetical protein
MPPDRLVFRVHALERMFSRGISVEDVRRVLDAGDRIEDYSHDTPYPSELLLGWRGSRPLHVVAARNEAAEETIIVTVYEPDADRWEPGFRRRKT